MHRTQSDTARRLLEARRIGNAESDRHNRLLELEADAEDDFSEGDEEEDDADGAANGMSGLAVSSSSAAPPVIPEEPVEEKTAEQLQDEADGWETVPKKGKKGGRK